MPTDQETTDEATTTTEGLQETPDQPGHSVEDEFEPVEADPSQPKSIATEHPELALAVFRPGDERGINNSQAFTLTDTGLVVREDLSYEEWVDGLRVFKWAQSKLQIGFADYLKFGEAKFGKIKVDESLEQLEFEMSDVKASLDINSIPIEIRYANLQAEHYVVLAKAKLNKSQQSKWARLASAQSLSPSQLKASIAAGEVVSPTQSRKQTHGIISIQGVCQEMDVWLKRVGGIEGILKMERDSIREIITELDPIAKLHSDLKAAMAKPAKKKKAPKKAKPAKREPVPA